MNNIYIRALIMSGSYATFTWFFAWVLINWLTGCGEQFPTANGGFIAGECVPFDLGLIFGK